MGELLSHIHEREIIYRRNFRGTMFAFDVDQVLANIVVGHLLAYNDLLSMDLRDDEIVCLAETYRSTFDVPAIIEARRNNEAAFQKARTFIRENVELHRHFPVMLNAHPMMNLISEQISLRNGVFGGYYSARPKNTGEVTLEWLQIHRFPHATEHTVFISEDPESKLIQLIRNWTSHHQSIDQIILVDDGVHKLQEAAAKLAVCHPKLKPFLERICVAAFSYGPEEIPNTQTPIKTTSLKDWHRNTVEPFLDTVSKT